MPDVRMPDGVVVRFPDTMSKDEIRAKIATKFPEVAPKQAPAGPDPRAGISDLERGGNAAAAGFIDSIPIVGPSIKGGLDKAGAGLASMIYGVSYDDALKNIQGGVERNIEEHPTAHLAGSVAGTVAPYVAAGGIPVAARALGMSGPTLGGRVLNSALSGGAISAADTGARGGDTGDVLTSAAIGGGIGGAVPALGAALKAGYGAIKGAPKSGVRIPEIDELKAKGSNAYKAAKEFDVVVSQPAMQRLQAGVQDILAEDAWTPELEPAINGVWAELGRQAKNNATMGGIDTIRKVAVKAAMNGNPSERRLAGKLIEHIDDFASDLSPQDVLKGDVVGATKALQEGRAAWKQYRKAELLDETLDKAERQTARSYSGGNIDNATRQKFDAILNNPKQSRQFTATEREIMRQIVKGAPGQNIARLLGKLSPTGSGLMAILQAGGAAAFGPMALAAPVVGMASKAASDRMTSQSVQKLVDAVRSGQMPPQALASLPTPIREAVARALLTAGANMALPVTAAQPQH
jgi:hypothetical protein